MRAAAKRQSDRTRKERPARQRARHQPMRAVSPHRVIPHPALSPSVIAKESGAAVSVRPGPRCRQRLTAGQGAREKEKREKINLKNQAETLIYQAEKQLGELGDKVAADDKAKVEGFTADLKAAVEKDDTAAIKATLEQLQQALYAAGASVYQQAGADGAPAGTSGGNGNGASAAGSSADDVIDAEFTESK